MSRDRVTNLSVANLSYFLAPFFHQLGEGIEDNFRFIVFPVDSKDKRLELESKIISTVSSCRECKPSSEWLGQFSPKDKIRKSGLWIVNELYKQPLTEEEYRDFEREISR